MTVPPALPATGETTKLDSFGSQLAERLGTSDPSQQLQRLDELLRNVPPLTVIVKYDRTTGQAFPISLDSTSLDEMALVMASASAAISQAQKKEKEELARRIEELEQKPPVKRGRKQ